MAPDKWFIKQIFRFFVWRYASSVQRELGILQEYVELGRGFFLKDKLKHCGHSVRLRGGVRIAQPENISIGDFADIGEDSFLMGAGGITIGDFCLLANKTVIATTNHIQEGIFYGTAQRSPVTLGENVWTGTGAIILPGVTVGDDCIIGAGAVVTHDIPSGQIALGVPARPVGAVPTDPQKRAEQAAAWRARLPRQ